MEDFQTGFSDEGFVFISMTKSEYVAGYVLIENAHAAEGAGNAEEMVASVIQRKSAGHTRSCDFRNQKVK